ncbi:hypothetical protein OIU77_017381 [Salix suchowensis]|uniref:Uncharacterized protein n=1 Tax=Salix suchowensis TaxID=1278906 RepID=A0ABQ8ZNR0_9ROSI|nr:hypothetical protein OIU77_017381 [Salix suchowensis]
MQHVKTLNPILPFKPFQSLTPPWTQRTSSSSRRHAGPANEHRKLFSCGQPDVDQVLDRYLAETERVPNNFPSLIKNNVENQLANKQEYAESLKRLEEEQTVAKMIGSMNNMNGGGFWWDLPIDNMEQDELEAYRESMEELKKNLIARLGLIESTCNALSESRIANPFINLKEIPSSLSFNSHQCQ